MKRKHIKVKLSAYPSKYFPVKAVFTVNGTRYSMVFETEEQAKINLENRLYPAIVSFCTA